MPLPADYLERVYAGVLGKLIGVYLGRPFEGWTHERIQAELGEVWYYVHDRLGKPLVVTDDDISGTFTFLRALPDYGNSPDITPAQIGQTWLNYIIENRTILWWGGLGNSTEHTAYLRLKSGMKAPESGSARTNGRVVSEQIGAQIFIDGWGMVCPGDPERAADLARRAASVSHDGEAIYGAQVVAALEAAAFVESDLNRLLDAAVGLIPRDSLIYRVIADLREWCGDETGWLGTREKLAERYGYHRYGGGCHMVPNHALIIHALLHGGSDFQKSLMIVNTCGWDTDCNSGNVGCILGIRNGLAGIEAGPDWRGPVADRMFLSTAEGGRAITDAVQESYRIVNIGRALAGEPPLEQRARFHFSLPDSVQGFMAEDSVEVRGVCTAENPDGGGLRVSYRHLTCGRPARVGTATFIPPDALEMPGYRLIASPTVYSGQTVRAEVHAEAGNSAAVCARLYLRRYGPGDELVRLYSKAAQLSPGGDGELCWTIPELEGYPIAEIGLEVISGTRADGTVTLNHLTWDGAPEVQLKPTPGGTLWKRAWVDAVDHFESRPEEPYRLIQDHGVGMISQGTRGWTDYSVETTVTPHMVRSCGLAARVQGLKRYYALLLDDGGAARLVKELDGRRTLGEAIVPWEFGAMYALRLDVRGSRVRAWLNGRLMFDCVDEHRPLDGGAVGLVCEEGRVAFGAVRVSGVES